MRVFRDRALHEHRTNLGAVPLLLPSSLVALSPGGGLLLSSTARVERGPSHGARSASTEDIGGHPLSSLQACSSSLQGWGLIDLPLRAAFSPTRPLARRDVPLARARASQFSLALFMRSGDAVVTQDHVGRILERISSTLDQIQEQHPRL